MGRRTRRYLRDIIETARLIRGSTEEMTIVDYETDIRLRHQIERELTIIGEAMSRLEDVDMDVVEQLSDYKGYIGLRNVLNHQYPDIDQATIWRTITIEIPVLIREVESLLAED